MAMQERVFGLKKCKYTIEEKKALAAKVKECNNGIIMKSWQWKGKLIRMLNGNSMFLNMPKQEYFTKAVHSFYSSLKEMKNDDKAL